MNTQYNRRLGKWGEDLASQFLIKQGYKLIGRNFVESTYGEIDLICQKDDEIIFVEVKTRTSRAFGDGEEAVSYYKQQKILKAIEGYLQDNETELSPRFDVIVVELFSLTPKFIHYENVEIG